ncbi:MAG: hypothetical protein WB424_05925 [Terracidiphilus sp.]
MDEPHTVPALSTSEAEEYWTTDTPAYSAENITPLSEMDLPTGKLPGRPCCTLVDMPGVGKVHAPDCRMKAVAAKIIDRMMIPPSKNFDVAGILVDIALAARALANMQINCNDGRMFCEECLQTASDDGFLDHLAMCNTGAIDSLFHALTRDISSPNQNDIADAKVVEKPRGFCMKCQTTDGEWQSQYISASQRSMITILPHQVIRLKTITESGFELLTHRCGSQAIEGGAR